MPSDLIRGWRPVRVKKTRQIKNLEPRFDSIETEKALGRVQSLRDVRDQIGRVFDADRQPDRGVENAYFLADVGRNPGVGHPCRQAGKRLGAAQGSLQLEDLKRV